MNIRRWSNTVGMIKSTIKPFGPSWIQLITLAVFDHLMIPKDWFHNPYKGSKHCRKTQSGSHLFLYRTDNICKARYHRTRIMEDNLILTSVRGVRASQQKFWFFLYKRCHGVLSYTFTICVDYFVIDRNSSCTDSTDLHGLHGLTSEKDNYLIHIAQWARYRAQNFLYK